MRRIRLLFIMTAFYLSALSSFAQTVTPPLATSDEKPQVITPEAPDSSKKLIWFPIGYYTPETKVAAGLLVIKNLWKEKEGHTSNVMGTASLTMNSQVLLTLSPRLYFDQGNWELGGILFYKHFPSKYYGRGVNNSLSSPEKYTENDFITGVNAGRNVYSNLFLRGGVAQDLRKITETESGGVLETEIRNSTASLQVLSLNMGLEWDERDYPQSPKQGAWYRINQTFYDPKDREGVKTFERFRKIDFDFRQYITLSKKWRLGAQWVASEVQGEQIPFQYLNSLGGGSRMRGYYSGQYRDRAMGILQAEIKYEKTEKWTAAVFAGTARMAEKISELNSADSFYSGGFGVHYTLDPENRTKFRLDIGFTGRETGVYFLIGEAF